MRPRAIRSSVASVIRERVVRRLLPHSVTADINRNDRVGALHRAWGHVFTSQLQGAYYEFGVYKGEAFRASRQVYQTFFDWQQGQLVSDEPWRRQVARPYAEFRHHFYAFDTFEGMPDNAEGNHNFTKGTFLCSLEEFSRLNRGVGIVEGPQVRYFMGTFAEVARRDRAIVETLQPAAIVNLDCDLYASARDALELVAPRLMQGTVLLVDDWNTFAARRDAGERKAIREFLQTHRGWECEPWFAYHYSGQAFLLHREAQRA